MIWNLQFWFQTPGELYKSEYNQNLMSWLMHDWNCSCFDSLVAVICLWVGSGGKGHVGEREVGWGCGLVSLMWWGTCSRMGEGYKSQLYCMNINLLLSDSHSVRVNTGIWLSLHCKIIHWLALITSILEGYSYISQCLHTDNDRLISYSADLSCIYQ